MDISDFVADDDVKDGDFTQEDADQVEAENIAQDRVEGFASTAAEEEAPVIEEPEGDPPAAAAVAADDGLGEEAEEVAAAAPAGRAVPSTAAAGEEEDEESIELDTRPIQIRKRRRQPIPADGIPAGTRVGIESDGVFGKKKAKKKKKPRKTRANADEADEAEEEAAEEDSLPPPPVNYQSVWPDTRIYPAPTSSFNYFARQRCEDDDNPNSIHRVVDRMANEIHMYSPNDVVQLFQKVYRKNVTGEGKTPLLKETDPARIKEGLYHRRVTPLAVTNQLLKTNFYTWMCGMESNGYVADDQGHILGVSEAAAKLTKQAVDNHVKLAKLLKT